MAKNFDNLITFLLGEIALCGEQGTTLSDLFCYVGTFFGDPASGPSTPSAKPTVQDSTETTRPPSSGLGSEARNHGRAGSATSKNNTTVSVQAIDRPFKETIWRWLTAHPDVYVGKEKQGNKLSLSQMEAKSIELNPNNDTPEDDGIVGVNTSQDSAASLTADRATLPTSKSKKQNAKDQQRKSDPSSRKMPLRVYISQERMWYALAGHEVDWTKLPRSEFQLLSIIGARRGLGIVQTDLIQISGQDKRSLPRRTDALHTKGYIEKKPALIKGQRTSLCTLRGYVSQATSLATVTSEAVTKDPANVTQEEKLRKCGFTGNVTSPSAPMLNPVVFVRTIMDYVREAGLITHMDLQRKLGITGLRWHMRVCAATVRKLEVMGCVRRVRARSIYSRTEQATHRSIKFLREPKEHEWNLQWDASHGIADSLRNEEELGEVEDEDEDVIADRLPLESARPSVEPQNASIAKDLQEASRVLPQWTPNRPLSNQLFDLVDAAGTEGISTMALKASSLGTHYQRPLEHHIERFTNSWQASQPLHLRHLAIVRDTAQTKKYAHYIHLSYDNFQKKVDAGETSWVVVETTQADTKKKPKGWHAIGAEPELDEYGFAPIPTSRFAGKNGDATLLESVLAASVPPHHLTTFDPLVFFNESGSYELDFPAEKGRGHSIKSIPNDPRCRKPNAPRREGDPRKKLGRPRKTEEEKAETARKKKPKTPKGTKLTSVTVTNEGLALGAPEEKNTLQSQSRTKRKADDAGLDNVIEPAAQPPKKTRGPGKKRQLALEASLSSPSPGITFQENNPSTFQAINEGNAVAVEALVGVSKKRRPVKKSQKALQNEIAATVSQSALRDGKPVVSSLNTPGVYINPPGSEKPGGKKKGRPRKTMIAVFRSNRLRDVDWSKNPLVIPGPDNSAATAPADVIAASGSTAQLGTTDDVLAQASFASMVKPQTKPRQKRGRKEISSDVNDATHDALQGPQSKEKGRKPPRKKRATGGGISSQISSNSLDTPEQLVAKGDRSTDNPETLLAKEITDSNAAPVSAVTDMQPESTDLVTNENPLDYDNVRPGAEVSETGMIREDEFNSMLPSLDQNLVHPEAVSLLNGELSLAGASLESATGVRECTNGELSIIASGPTTLAKTSEAIVHDSASYEVPTPDGDLPLLEVPLINPESLDTGTGSGSTTVTSADVELGNMDMIQQPASSSTESQKRGAELVPTITTPIEQPEARDQADGAQSLSSTNPNVDLATLADQAVEKEEHAIQPNPSSEQMTGNVDQEVEEVVAPALTKPLPKSGPAKKPSGIYAGRGSLGFKKRQIILGIVEKCGGMFPGDKELWYPFTTAWVKPGDQSRPDPRTVVEAKKGLIDSGKLRRIVFCFKNSKGLMMTKHIITLPEVAPDSEAVQAMQERMIKEEPGYYLPPQVEISEEVRKELNIQNRNILPRLPVEVERETLVEIGHKLPSMIVMEQRRLKEEKKREKKRKKEEKKAEKAKQREKRRLVRQAHQQWDILHGLTAHPRRPGRPSKRLREDDGDSSGYETVPDTSSISNKRSGRPRKRSKEDDGLQKYERVMTLDMLINDEAPAHLAASAGPSTSYPRNTSGHQTQPEPSAHHQSSLEPSDRAAPGVASPVSRVSLSNTTTSTADTTPQYSPQIPPRIYSQSDLPSLSRLSPSPQEAVNTDLPIPSVDQHATAQNDSWHNLGPASFNRDYNVQKYTTLMNPKQRLHRATGTFSTEYSVVGHARQDLWVQPPNMQEMFENFLPTQLKDILDIPRRGRSKRHHKQPNPTWSKFVNQVDIVARWEINEPRLLNSKTKRWRLIEHEYIGAHVEACSWIPPLQFNTENMTNLDDPPNVNIDDSTPEETSPRRKRGRPPGDPDAIRLPKRVKVARPAKQPPTTRRKRGKPQPKTRRMTSLAEMAVAREQREIRAGKGNQLEINEDGGFSVVRHRRGRGSAAQYYMPQSDEQKLMTAVVVIRILTGGLNRNIDWVLVADLFKPDYEQRFLQSSWPRIMQKNRLHVDKLERDFQEAFIEAYENNVVPPIDYDNLLDYDWAWLVEWAQENLDMPDSKRVPDLPATRKELDDMFNLRNELTSSTPWREAYFDDHRTIVRRTELINSFPNVIPLHSLDQKDKPQDHKLEVGKSWVKANVIAPEETYNSDLASAKLGSLGEATLSSAIKSLLASKVIVHENKGRVVPGRNYDVSKAFLDNLKRMLDESHFQHATTFKAGLDAAFRRSGEFVFSYHAKDGEVLAAMNLVTSGRVRLKPRNEPIKPFGLLNGSYKTRSMDKRKLLFDVILTPSPTYVYGNPLLPLPPAPMAPKPNTLYNDNDQDQKIPAWYDIYGEFVPALWRVIVACVVGTLALRPGTTVAAITRYVRPSLEPWEVEKVIAWLVSVGVAQPRGEGWDVLEWWWLVVWPEIDCVQEGPLRVE